MFTRLVQANVMFIMEEGGALIVSDDKCVIVHTGHVRGGGGAPAKAPASMKRNIHSIKSGNLQLFNLI